MSRIVITGMGAVTPVGIGAENYIKAIQAGQCGIAPITKIDTDSLPVKIAGEIKGFDPLDYIPKKTAENMVDFMHYAYAAAEEALSDSGLEIAPYRTGIIMGTALDGLTEIGRTQRALDIDGKKVGPKFLTKVLGNLAPAQFAITHGIKGPSMTVNTACSSGGDAMTMAAMMLNSGEADAMVVMAGECGVSPLLIGCLAKSQALTRNNDDPQHASRPFDVNRNGFVIGEGGGAFILETLEHAERRGADIKAEFLGYANNTDAYHMVAPHPHGEGAAECVRLALAKAGLAPEQVGYLNAHGTSTTAGDIAEAEAIKAAFGGYGREIPVSSTKGATGHLMGAGGITEVIACISAIRDGILPPNLNCDEKDPLCDINVVTKTGTGAKVDVAMSNSLGFGGQNSCIIVGRYNG